VDQEEVITQKEVFMLGVLRLILVVASITMSGCSPMVAEFSESRSFQPQTIEKIAVVVVNELGVPKRNVKVVDSCAARVEDVFIRDLISKGYRVATRSDKQFVLAEIDFQQSGATEVGAAELGRMLNVSAVVLVRINENKNWSEMVRVKYSDGTSKNERVYKARTTIAARLVSVEQAEVLWVSSRTEMGNVEGPDGNMAREAASRVAAAFPYRELPLDKEGNPYDPRLNPKGLFNP